MGVISITDSSKNIECTDLEAHVLMAQHRYKVLEDRIIRAEAEIAVMKEHAAANRRIIIGAVISVITGACISLISFLLRG